MIVWVVLTLGGVATAAVLGAIVLDALTAHRSPNDGPPHVS